jgi:2-amino-4-hydroxy-6-hydroxymethyldihydropteridine diphosphokinase
MLHTAHLMLGSNMGNALLNLNEAIVLIEKNIGKIIKSSAFYKSEAWGFTNQADFFNQALKIKTLLKPFELLVECQKIETILGRKRSFKNAPRLIDIDILFYENESINESHLTIPHKEIPNRKFVLIPLNEIDKNFKHPLLQISVSQLLKQCNDELNVQKI